MFSHCSAGEKWKLFFTFPSVVLNVYAFAIILFLLRLQFLHSFFFPFLPYVAIIIYIYLFTLHLCASIFTVPLYSYF